ncbi:MAG: molybdopterin-synthase adenylyltransferase MoeB [Rhodospirillaceae bacterium]
MDFTDHQLERYARHIMLPEVGGTGQERLLGARVLVVGAGGLGSPLLLYLAAAGIGTLGVVDPDVVDLSNLQRQVIHDGAALGQPKVASAALRIRAINPEVRVETHQTRLSTANAAALIAGYDVIADGTDNFTARFLINDACFFAGKTLVSAAILRFEGQISTFKPHAGPAHPCYRCLFPEPPPPGLVPSCAEGGVFGALAGAVGSFQAVEVLKEVLGIGDSLSGNLLLIDALSATFRKIRVPRDPHCRLCGAAPAITGLPPALSGAD